MLIPTVYAAAAAGGGGGGDCCYFGGRCDCEMRTTRGVVKMMRVRVVERHWYDDCDGNVAVDLNYLGRYPSSPVVPMTLISKRVWQ